DLTLLETMERNSPEEMRTKLRNILGAFMFSGEDVDKKVSVLSGGERARLALACLLLRPFNLLVLDEPTNHLDMISKDVLKEALKQYDGTMIVVSHDRDFLRDLTASTLEFRDRQLFHYPGDVEYFLERRAVEDMRAVELHKTAEAGGTSAVAEPAKVMDYETRKRLLRTISNAEKKVERLEEQKAKMDLQMAEESFYTSPEFPAFMDKYKALKAEIEAAEEAWEEAQMEWEEAGGE
ncbi:MAG: ATP-binding cassette domain-containing protein, partial [Bacteroidota bacterium]